MLGLGRVRVSPSGSPDRSDLTLGYGGLQIRYRPAPDTTFGGWHLSLLAGAGTARIRSTLAGAELGSENFGVVEPTLAYRWPLREGMRAGLSLGYRFVFADEPLPGMSSSELHGPVLSLLLHLVRDP